MMEPPCDCPEYFAESESCGCVTCGQCGDLLETCKRPDCVIEAQAVADGWRPFDSDEPFNEDVE